MTIDKQPHYESDPNQLVDRVIERVGQRIVLGTPLGIGKANHFINALYRRAKNDPSLELLICTGLTLERPKGKSELEKRFINIFSQRLFGDYPDLDFELDRVANMIPPNIQVIEFFMTPAKYLNHPHAQRNYISTNYTHAARDMLSRGVNVLAQIISPSNSNKYSLSCNPDVSLDLAPMMRASRPCVIIGQVNTQLPYMYGDAEVSADFFDFILEGPDLSYQLFGTPKESISDPDYLIGLYVSRLIKDGGELQIGIGALGDAITYFLIMRHENPKLYHEILDTFQINEKFQNILLEKGESSRFTKGLYSATEMIVEGFIHLIHKGILKRKVYSDVNIQRLLNQGVISEKVTEATVHRLIESGALRFPLNRENILYLKKFGILKEEAPLIENLDWKSYLGDQLKNGVILHGGFYLGSNSLYKSLSEMDIHLKHQIHMTSVCKINQLYGHEELDRLHRRDARFVNTCLMVTLSGAAISDGLDNHQVLSGVGGQYNFIAMAHELPDGHSILCLRSTRTSKGRLYSNIVWEYPHMTIPRHLRDIFITEYGIAYLRGKSDEEIIKALLNITDSRFQEELLMKAKKAKKIENNYEIPHEFRNNFPHEISNRLSHLRSKNKRLAPIFPFGSDFKEDELVIARGLKKLKAEMETKSGVLKNLLKALFVSPTPNEEPYLKMMNLSSPQKLKEKILSKLVTLALKG